MKIQKTTETLVFYRFLINQNHQNQIQIFQILIYHLKKMSPYNFVLPTFPLGLFYINIKFRIFDQVRKEIQF